MKKWLLILLVAVSFSMLVGCGDEPCSCNGDSVNGCVPTDGGTDALNPAPATDTTVPDTVTASSTAVDFADSASNTALDTVISDSSSLGGQDTQTEAGVSGDSVAGIESDATETDSASESQADSSGMDTTGGGDTGLDCAGMKWECGTGTNNKGYSLDCGASGGGGCANTGQWCNGNKCETCNTDDRCGPSCVACGTGSLADKAHCLDGERCVACIQNDDCPAETPACNVADGTCVECTRDDDCRTGSNAWVSPIGVCTPGNVCTCWVPENNPTAECHSNESCPDGFYCAQDIHGSGRFVCMRECAAQQPYWGGIACSARYTMVAAERVWAPFTTCFAFARFGANCEADEGGIPDDSKCRISDDLEDGYCMEQADGRFACTFSCYNTDFPLDNVCPTYPGVMDACDDYIGICHVPE